MDGWTLSGTILSAIGAVVSVSQAYKAKSYRDEILTDRLRLALIDMLSSAKHAREESKKIATPVNKPMRGVDPDKVISTIQICAEKLKENGHRFGVPEIKDISSALETLIKDYKSVPSGASRQQFADQIYTSLNMLVAHISQRIDSVV